VASPLRTALTVTLPLAIIAWRIYRHLFRRGAGCNYLAARHVYGAPYRELPDCGNHRAGAAGSLGRLYAADRAVFLTAELLAKAGRSDLVGVWSVGVAQAVTYLRPC
jgi:hypothetical protein